MADPIDEMLTRESLVQLAREQSGLEIKEGEAEDLAELVIALQVEARPAYALAHGDEEPATVFALEEWPHD